MAELFGRGQHPELKQLVAEASRALAQLDAGRLEELALSCQALNRDLAASGTEDHVRLARQTREAAADMAVFSRVLDVTRGNLNVIQRLQDLRAGRLEYAERPAISGCAWTPGTSRHGDN
jgi:hypothetical protein